MGAGGSCIGKAPTRLVTCKVWIDTQKLDTFPELSDDGDHGMPSILAKPNFGLCLSGGGMRAATTAMGVIRAFHKMELLPKLRFLSTTSGASWLNGPLSFGNYASLDDFLGEYIPPEQLSVEKLQISEDPGTTFPAVLADGNMLMLFMGKMLGDIVELDWLKNESRGWSESVAKTFLDAFGIGDLNKSTATAMGTRGSVDQRIAKAAEHLGLKVYMHRNLELPFPIITECILQPNDPRMFFPWEWTPLYQGMPMPITDSAGVKYGNCLVEPIGHNSKVVKRPAEGTLCACDDITVELDGPSSVGEAVGISSGYIPLMLPMGKDGTTRNISKMLGSSASSYWSSQDWKSSTVQWADGGGVDVLGIYPLLRRKVSKIVVWLASGADPKDRQLWTMQACGCVPLCFGKYDGELVNKIPNVIKNQIGKVFDSAHGLDAMWADLQTKLEEEGPVWHRAKYSVAENAFQGVRGGWEVDVLWVFNTTCTSWEAALPHTTRELLACDRTSNLEKVARCAPLEPFTNCGLGTFPLISTNCMNYSPELVVMLSNQAAWAMHQLEGQLREMTA